jgi:hypothetical protein
MNRYTKVRELVKDPSFTIKNIAQQTGYNKGHVSRLRKEFLRQALYNEAPRGEGMSENKNAKTPADGPVAWGCQCGRAYTVTCISSKPAKQWVGLTDEEIQDLSYLSQKIDEGNSEWFDRLGFAKAIEQALKKKNHG